MIGRERELAELRELLELVMAAGSGRAVVVEGEPGIGKSALVAALTGVAVAAGFQPLRCAGFQRQALVGFAALHELVHPVLDRVPALPPRQRAALLTAFGLQEGPAPDRLLIALAVLGLLEEVAATRPLLLVVEDAQWLDVSSAGVVGFVARRLHTAPIALVATTRTTSGGEVALERTREVLNLGGAEHLHVPPLSAEHSERLLSTLDTPPAVLTRAVRQRVLEEAGGNPLALREFVHAQRARGGDEAVPLGVPLPTTRRLEAAYLAEVADLPAASGTLLLLAAAGEELTLPELLAAGHELGLTPQDLIPLERTDLVSVVADRLQLRHPLLRSAIYGAASSIERIEAHRVLAGAVRDGSRAACHRAAATVEPDESVAAELEAAATRGAQRGARAEAAAALRRASELSVQGEDQARRMVQAAELARQAGSLAQAEQILTEMLTLPMSPQHRAERTHVRRLLGYYQGEDHSDPSDELAYARELAGPSGTEHPEERITILTTVAFGVIHHYSGDLAVDEAVRRRVHDELAAVKPPSWSGPQQLGLAVLDPLAHAAAVRPALPRILQQPPPVFFFLLSVAMTAELLQDLPTARRAWIMAAEAFQRAGSSSDVVRALDALAVLHVIAGDLSEALATAEQARRTALDLEFPLVAASAEATAAQVHVWTGHPTLATEALGRSRALLTGARIPNVTAGIAWAAGSLALHEGRPLDAVAELRGVVVDRAYAQWAVADLTEAAVRAGEPESARELLADAEEAARELGSPHLQMLVHRSRALLADGGEAEGHYEAALAAGAHSDAPLELARTHLLYGEWLRRARRVLEAREHLTVALEALHAAGAGAGPLALRASAELAAAGAVPASRPAPPTAPSSPTASSLTAQELQIARLAAQGLTNKEIADRIYLSHRTVSTHLYKVFPKLGITNRRQLREVLLGDGSSASR
ncbi:ATP-binding protein [Kineococcus radiotolerans]|uniref:Regulatory protein LuxR n=1 Tax=Kineococcus radiotolerans (strain ATCC BAA-149 / DSM 14245 / SRS30216) TaxID=266940 RepID=A6WAD3_KINRD|nr:LuxR family transcriptional regulator [Kineococcus radiotolerans]ABS03772.1 regulatory protein LuxR [Kineococcus radiotolerans SRS30216 = ATCC BAA-149]